MPWPRNRSTGPGGRHVHWARRRSLHRSRGRYVYGAWRRYVYWARRWAVDRSWRRTIDRSGRGSIHGSGRGSIYRPGRRAFHGPHPWRRDNFMARAFRPAVRRAELEGLTFHDLRHTYASLMVAAGVTPHVIAEQLGHRDARLVLQRYGHLYPGASRQAAVDLDLYLQAVSVGHTWGGDR